MTKPHFPIITIYKDFPEISLSERELESVNLLAVLKVKNVMTFDKEGVKWSYDLRSNQVKDNLWTRLAANTFYNPMVQAQLIWTKVDRYTMAELRETLKECVNKDDDLLTQFMEPAELKSEIDKAQNFQDLCSALKKAEVDPVDYGEQKE